MTHRTTAAILCGLLALTGCTTTTRVGDDPHLSPEARMREVADRFERDRSEGGMAAVIADVQQCYRDATVPAILPWPLRDCLVLDTIGFEEDVNVGRRIFHQSVPFWVNRAYALRTWHYGQLDGFQTPAQLGNYIADGSALVHRYLKRKPQAPSNPVELP